MQSIPIAKLRNINFPTKYLINDACEIYPVGGGTPWVYSAILAFEGQLSVFNLNGGPNYRDMLPTPPPPGDVSSPGSFVFFLFLVHLLLAQ
jgi:molybdopterin/thiamine biosynthesis adenylyltransferase